MAALTCRFVRRALCAAALLTVFADLAAAAPARIATNTNLRMGPGLNFGVIATAPAGSVVDVIRCGPEWCNVMWNGRPGYMIGRNLVGGAPPVVVAPAPAPVVVVGPPYYRPYYYGPRFYYGPRYYRGYWRRW